MTWEIVLIAVAIGVVCGLIGGLFVSFLMSMWDR